MAALRQVPLYASNTRRMVNLGHLVNFEISLTLGFLETQFPSTKDMFGDTAAAQDFCTAKTAEK